MYTTIFLGSGERRRTHAQISVARQEAALAFLAQKQ